MKTKKKARPAKRTATKKKISKKTTSAPEDSPQQGIWSGTISFSLVAIPVRLIRAVESGRVSFHMLHSKDFSRLRRKMFCPTDEKIVAPEEIVRGYEIEPGKHIVVTDAELESISPERSRTIEIAQFIDTGDIDPIFYDHPYYLVPLKGGEKSYTLLAQIMQQTNRAGIAKFVLDEREYLVIVKSRQGALVLSTLHYADEILPDKEFVTQKAEADESEKNSFKETIKKMIGDFAPEQYVNERREKLLALIQTKTKKDTVQAPPLEDAGSEGVEDLVAVLEKSMHKSKKGS